MAQRLDGLSAREARWLAIAAQGLGRARPTGPIRRQHLRTVVDAVDVIQLDAINVVARTQFLVPFSRIGLYEPEVLHGVSGPGGELFEYWGHAASLLPMASQPLYRWRMAEHGSLDHGSAWETRRREWRESNAAYIQAVLDEIRDRGPLPASALSDPRRRDGEWWERRSEGRQALEALFAQGRLAGWRTRNFERVYDLPERVIPPAVRDEPTPPADEAQRRLVLRAARSLGVATVPDLADYHHLRPRVASSRVAELVEAGELIPVSVEGWRDRAYTLPGARPRRPRRAHATLLSPFDSLIWDRRRTRRLFAFDYRIEVYVPQPARRYGYYVLPLLLGDALVARLDLKADRSGSALRVVGAHLDPAADGEPVAAAAVVELAVMQRWLGLDRVLVAPNGDLAPALQRVLASSSRP
jgi:uncharacterized protein